jgi:hypothetical protein
MAVNLFFVFLVFLAPQVIWAQGHWETTPEALSEIGKIKDCNNYDLAKRLLQKEFHRLVILEWALSRSKKERVPELGWDNIRENFSFFVSEGVLYQCLPEGKCYPEGDINSSFLLLSESEKKLRAQAVDAQVNWKNFIESEQSKSLQRISRLYYLLGEADESLSMDWKKGIIPKDLENLVVQKHDNTGYPICKSDKATLYLHHLASYWSLEEARANQYFSAKDKDKELKDLVKLEQSKSKDRAVRRVESEKAKHFDEYLNLSDSQGLVHASLEKIVFKAEELPPVKPRAKKEPAKETRANGMLVLEKRMVGAGPNGTDLEYWKDISINTRTGKPNNIIWGPVEDFEKVKKLQKDMKLTVENKGKEPDYVRAAEEFCKNKEPKGTWFLPPIEIFLDALNNHMSEKGVGIQLLYGGNKTLKDNLPDMKDRWFFLSSSDPSNAAKTLFFGGRSGRVGSDGRGGDGAVRCVSRAADR